jgi:hypothetical protein
VTSVVGGVLPRKPPATVALVRGDAELARWSMPCAGGPDLVAVNHLARLALAARRLGCAIRLVDPDPELLGLLAFVGLAEVSGLAGQVVGKAEHREQVGAEEVVVPDDPVA